MKTCRKCQALFDGKYCHACAVARVARWAAKNPEKIKAKNERYKAANEEKMRAARKKWRSDNPEKSRASNSTWNSSNRAAMRLVGARYRAAKIGAAVRWADKGAMRVVYAEAQRLTRITGIQYDVDHVVPLQSPVVCGLHCEFNLRVITSDENKRKQNRWDAYQRLDDRKRET